jgi:hypothetical protein
MGRGDFGAAGPLAAPLPGVRLIIQAASVGLYHVAIFQEQEPRFFGWHFRDECFGFFKRRAQLHHDRVGIDWFSADEFKPFSRGMCELRRISAMSPSGVKAGNFSTAAHTTAPRGKIVS